MCVTENAPPAWRRQVELFQSRALDELREYEAAAAHGGVGGGDDGGARRLTQLLVKLPALRSLSPAIMEELFFAGACQHARVIQQNRILETNTNTFTGIFCRDSDIRTRA